MKKNNKGDNSSTVAAIIINYKHYDLTVKCIKSLGKQVDFVVVVDNSEDEYELNNLLSTSIHIDNKNFPEIKVLCPELNLGFGKGVNFAIRFLDSSHKKYDYILVINNDCTVFQDTIKKLISVLDRYNGYAMVSPTHIAGEDPSLIWYNRLTGIITPKKTPWSFPYLCGACILTSRELVLPHLFDPDFFMYGEDVELGWRMKSLNVPLIPVQEAKFHHIGSVSAPHGGLFYEYHVAKGHLLLAKKLALTKLESISFHAGNLLFLIIRAVIRSLRYKNTIPIKALIALFNDTPPASPHN